MQFMVLTGAKFFPIRQLAGGGDRLLSRPIYCMTLHDRVMAWCAWRGRGSAWQHAVSGPHYQPIRHPLFYPIHWGKFLYGLISVRHTYIGYVLTITEGSFGLKRVFMRRRGGWCSYRRDDIEEREKTKGVKKREWRLKTRENWVLGGYG